MDKFTTAYIEAAIWSTWLENKNYSVSDFAKEALAKINADCQKFQQENILDTEGLEARAGHDFWLTRNGHGCGFWDGDWPEVGDRLTVACKAYPPVDLYVGDDGKIYY